MSLESPDSPGEHIPNAEPTAPPPPLPPAERWRRRRRTVLPALIGVALIVLAAVLTLRWADDERTAVGDATPASGAVRFLEAVADGDAERALSLQHQPPADRTLLTAEVLDRSRRIAPISDIRVVEATPELVEVSYVLGREEVHAQFVPVRRPNGSYKIDQGTTLVQVSRPEHLPVFVNGVRLTTDEVHAFPGTYELTTGEDNIGYAEPLLTVSGPETHPQVAPNPRLTARGTNAFLAATRDRLTACMQSHEVNPPGCPQSLDIAEGTAVDPASVQWTLEKDPLIAVTPKLSLTDESIAEVRLSVRARLQASVGTPTGPGMVNQPATFDTVATGRVTEDPISVDFVAS